MTERVSCVIPVFNGEGYLALAIESVLAQTYPNLEVIVVDDGSSDGSPEVARAFGDRVTYLRQDNGGASVARNAGIRYASGPSSVSWTRTTYGSPLRPLGKWRSW